MMGTEVDLPTGAGVSPFDGSRTVEEVKAAVETEKLARNLVAAFSVLLHAQVTGEPRPPDVVRQAKQALAALTVTERNRIESACRPATAYELAGFIGMMLAGNPQSAKHQGGDQYATILVADISALSPSVGAIETGCRKIRTTSPWLPKIPDVLDAVREAGSMYAAAVRAADELPVLIARAQRGP